MLPLTPHGYWRIVLQASQILTESHTVIALRLSGMAGLWPMAEVENQRMISEKLTAATQATHAAIRTGAASWPPPAARESRSARTISSFAWAGS